MGQKTNPIGNRLGIIKGWDSSWFGGKEFAQKVVEDEQIRVYLNARIQKGGISKIVIERTLKRVTVTLHTSRPGIIIGKGGQEVDRIKEELKKLTGKDVQIYKRAIKMSIQSAMRAGAEGIKVRVSGRLNGAEMARSEEFKDGRTPLHTFRADIDYSIKEALTVYGKIGIKTWICKGEVLEKRDLSPNAGMSKANESSSDNRDRGNDRRGNDGRDRGDRRGGNDRRGGDRRDGGNKKR